MAKLTLDVDALRADPRLGQLCAEMRWPVAMGLGALTLLWHTTRQAGLDVVRWVDLQPHLPVDAPARPALMRALLSARYITATDERGVYRVEGNADHLALLQRRRDAGRKGGQRPWPKPEAAKPARKAVAAKKATTKALVRKPASPPTTAFQDACRAAWDAYQTAFTQRYAVPPVRNAKVNRCIQTFVQRVGQRQAPAVLAFFVQHHDRNYLHRHHDVALAVRDAEALVAQWQRNEPRTYLESVIEEREKVADAQVDHFSLMP